MTHQTFEKPRKGEYWLEKRAARRVTRGKAKRAEAKRVRDAWNMTRSDVYRRDAGRCRAFGLPLKLASLNPFEVGHVHHVRYRSAGGTDDLSNLLMLSPRAHGLIHEHRLRVDGDANGTVTFTRVEPETGQVLEAWESGVLKQSVREERGA